MSDKETIKMYLVNKYIEKEYTSSYIFGNAVKGIVYAARVENAAALLPAIAYLDKASSKNGGTYSLKYRPNLTQWSLICSQAVEIRPVCTLEYFENLFKTSKYNRGQIFEKLVAQVFGGELESRSNLTFVNGGDMNLNGVAYQIKYTKATFTDERTLMNLRG